MNAFAIADLSEFPGMWIASALAALVIGYGAGILHFRSLHSVARRLVAGDLTAVGLQLVRLLALGGLLCLFALGGAHLLLAAAGGVFLARGRVLAREGQVSE